MRNSIFTYVGIFNLIFGYSTLHLGKGGSSVAVTNCVDTDSVA